MMKVQGNSPNHETSSATRLEQVRTERQGRGTRSEGSGQDRVELSSDVELVSKAVKAAGETPAIRQDVVQRAKQKLMAGQVGHDTIKLADKLIDHLLER
jgi:flagellar biosynthesis anti-sigma factor FlgM